jgi:hypothetical protein
VNAHTTSRTHTMRSLKSKRGTAIMQRNPFGSFLNSSPPFSTLLSNSETAIPIAEQLDRSAHDDCNTINPDHYLLDDCYTS